MVRFLMVAVVAAGLVGCGGGPAPSQEFGKEDATQIRQLVSNFVSAYNAQDVEKLAALFSGNAVIMPPNRSTLRGVELVKTYFEGRLKEEGATDLVLDELTLDGQGSLAYVFTTYQLNLRPAGGAEERYRGKVILDREEARRPVAFRRADDEWRHPAGRAAGRAARPREEEVGATRFRHHGAGG